MNRDVFASVGGSARRVGILAAGAVALMTLANASAQNMTWTLDADFDSGVLLNVNHDAPNNDQLQLNTTTTPFPFVSIACSSRGTAVRIDVNTGAIIGEYLTSPDGMGRNPSRTTVDQFGNVWVSNRDEGGFSGGAPKGSVARIGLVMGGTRCDADGTPNPGGQYLKPPFLYNTCTDRDGDGLIKTSFGLGNILPWSNSGGADIDGGVSTADDECIINYTRVVGTNTRTVAVDPNNDLWTGGLGNLTHEKVSGVTGLPIPGTQFNTGCGGYGGLVDGNNVLWSTRGGGWLLRYDATALTAACLDFNHGDYGIGIDPNTGHIWQTHLDRGTVVELAPDGSILNTYGHGNTYAQGVAVDGSGNVWVAHSLIGPATTVGHLRTDGTYVGNVVLPGGSGPTGVAVDANGKVWVANIYSDNAMRIDPSAGPIGGGGFPVGAVDLTVSLGAGAGPYNYSDMTGFVAIGSTAPQGTWNVVWDSNRLGNAACELSWTSDEPSGTSVTVEVRAADNPLDLTGLPFVGVSNGGSPVGVNGQHWEIRATLARTIQANLSPILYDLSISCNEPPACPTGVSMTLWPPNHMYTAIDLNTAAGVTDPDGDPVNVTITSITQDEPVNSGGDGNTLCDGVGVSGSIARIRAERMGSSNGRVYCINYTADDGNGGTCTGTFKVNVPKSQNGRPAIDDGQNYDSTFGCAPAPSTKLSADIDGNGVLNSGDLIVVLSAFGDSASNGTFNRPEADINLDGHVNLADVAHMLEQMSREN